MKNEPTFEAEFWTKDTHLAHRGEQRAELGCNAESLFGVLEHQLRAGDVARCEMSNDEGRTWRAVAVTATLGSLSWKKEGTVPATKHAPRLFRVRWSLQ